jgi:hypothetical protein
MQARNSWALRGLLVWLVGLFLLVQPQLGKGQTTQIVNPLDTLGRWHNRLLSELMQSGETDEKVLWNAAWRASNTMTDSGFGTRFLALSYDVEETQHRMDVYAQLGIRASAQHYLEAVFHPAADPANWPMLEAAVLNADDLNEHERFLALGTYSIAQNSLRYWTAIEDTGKKKKRVKKETYIEFSSDGPSRRRRVGREAIEKADTFSASRYPRTGQLDGKIDSTTTAATLDSLYRNRDKVPIGKVARADAFGFLKGAIAGGVFFGFSNLLFGVRDIPAAVGFSGAMFVAPAIDSARYVHKFKNKLIKPEQSESTY